MQPSADKPSQLRVDCVTLQSAVTARIVDVGGGQPGRSASVSEYVCSSDPGSEGSGMFGVCGHTSMCMRQWRPSHTVLKAFIHGRLQASGSVQ